MNAKNVRNKVKWSSDAELFKEKVLPRRMENNVMTGMPKSVAAKAMLAAIRGAEEIAKRTDGIVDVMDLRVVSIAYVYNTKMALLGPTLENACTEIYCVETGAGPLWEIKGLPCEPCKPVNALEGSGVPPVACQETLAWICANARAIDESLPIASNAHGVYWNEKRPISEAPECKSK